MPDSEPEAAVRRLLAGRGGAVAFRAGVGMGKSWTLDRLAGAAAAAGIATVRSRLHEPEDLTLARLLDDLLPEGAPPATGAETAPARASRLAGLIAERWSATPALVLVDDLHWAGPDALRLVAELCRLAATRPLGVAVAFRPWPERAARECARLAHAGRLILRPIDPLQRDGASALLGREPSADVDELLDLCGGNPLLLTGIAGVMELRGEVVPDAGAVVSAMAGASAGFTDLLGVDETARACATAASVLGDRFRPELAIDVAGVDRSRGDEALHVLCRLGFLHQGPGHTLEFAQPLLQRIVYAELTPPTRVRLHGRAFEALARRGFERRAAGHATLANLSGSEDAIGLLERVGHAALRDGAWRDAAHSFRAALELANDRATPDLRLALAAALLRGGTPAPAARILERMLQEPLTPEVRVASLRLLAQTLDATGEREAAVVHLEQAAAVAVEIAPASAVEALVDAALVRTRLGHIDAALELSERAVAIPSVEPAGADAALCRALARAFGGTAEAIIEVEERSVALAARAVAARLDGRRFSSLAAGSALVLGATGRLDAAEQLLSAAVEALRGRGLEGATGALLALQADVDARLGRIDSARRRASAAVAAPGVMPGDRAFARVVHARVLLDMGRGAEADAEVAEGERLLEGVDDGLAALWLRGVRAGRAAAEGEIGAAARIYTGLEASLRRHGCLLPGVFGWEVPALAALARAGEAPGLGLVLERLDACASPSHPWAEFATALGHGLAAERSGDAAAAEERLRRAAALAGSLPAVLDRVQAGYALGSHLRRRGRDNEATRLLGEAQRLAADAGATGLSHAIAPELAAAGNGGRRGAAPGELTPQERRVAGRAAAGMSNREIASDLAISVNTVETHLQRAFAKLGVRTRVHLARELRVVAAADLPA